jgi:hypothetical protein
MEFHLEGGKPNMYFAFLSKEERDQVYEKVVENAEQKIETEKSIKDYCYMWVNG